MHDEWATFEILRRSGRILVLLEPSLLVHDCLFVRENPAYFAANLHMYI